MTIYFDMDGTIADFYGVNNWLDYLINHDTFPYEAANPLCDCEKVCILLNELKYLGIKAGIVSWCSKNSTPEYDAEIRKAKREWLKENFSNVKFDEIHIVKYGTPKHQIVKDNGILIDDEAPNRQKWTKGAVYDPAMGIENILHDILKYL